MTMRLKLLIIFIILVNLKVYSNTNSFYIIADYLFDGEHFYSNKIIYIENNYIKHIFDITHKIPNNSEVIYSSNSTILPGFIDSHTHITAFPFEYTQNFEKYGWGKLAEEGYSLVPENRLNYLLCGITTIINMGNSLNIDIYFKSQITNKKILSPEYYFCGPLFTAPNGHPAGTIYKGAHNLIDDGTIQIDKIENVKTEIKRLYESGVDFIKIVYDDGDIDKNLSYYGRIPRLKLELIKEIINESRKFGLKVYSHIGDNQEAIDMILSGVDGIEHGFNFSNELFIYMASNNIIYTPTLSIYLKFNTNRLTNVIEGVKKAFDNGVEIALGTDFPSSGGTNCGIDFFNEMKLLENCGIPRLSVLRSATYVGAKKINKSNELGRILPNYKANLVFYKGNILEGDLDHDKVEKVIIDGNLIIKNKTILKDYEKYFEKKHLIISPYGYYDPINWIVFGLNIVDFNLFNTYTATIFNINYGLKQNILVDFEFSIPSFIPKTTITPKLYFDNFNRYYFESGNNYTTNYIEYSSLRFIEKLLFNYKINNYFYIDFQLDSRQYYNILSNNISQIQGILGGIYNSFSIGINFDTRDNYSYPWEGLYISINGKTSIPYISDYFFQLLNVDFRYYYSFIHHNILAFRFFYQQSFGETPFYFKPMFGDIIKGRGIIRYFYDNICLGLQLEYRFPIWYFIKGYLFLDIGQVKPHLFLFNIQDFHYTYGLGTHISLNPQEYTILSFEFGFSQYSWIFIYRYGIAY